MERETGGQALVPVEETAVAVPDAEMISSIAGEYSTHDSVVYVAAGHSVNLPDRRVSGWTSGGTDARSELTAGSERVPQVPSLRATRRLDARLPISSV